ncbi:obg-like ATPase homolog [Monosporozyma servazzii]
MNFLGRQSNNLSVGIVGLANIGKSTFFQNITHSKLGNPANYPFATIEPAHAIIQIHNDILTKLKQIYNSQKITPSTLTVIDIAGLTKGASDGKGLGNKFLNDIKLVDGLFHLVRAFKDDNITHLETNVDPIRDMGLVQDELILKDLNIIESIINNNNKKLTTISKNNQFNLKSELQYELKFFDTLQDHLYNGQKISNYKYNKWTQEEINILNKYNFLTSKPSLILLNVNPEVFLSGKYSELKGIQEWRDQFAPHDRIMLFSNEFESGNKDDSKSVLPKIIQEMKSMLQLINFYTCGPLEVRQWNIRNGTTAHEAAGVIHTDLQSTFINAEITKIHDLINTINESKKKPLTHKVGKDYIMQDDDIVYFKATKGKN